MKIDTSLEVQEGFKEKMLPLGVGVVILVMSIAVLKPLVRKSLALRQKNRQDKEKLAVLLEKAEKLEELNERQLQAKVEEVEKVLPSQKPVLVFLDSLRILAEEKEVGMGSISFSPGKVYSKKQKSENPNAENISLSFQINGELEKISDFLDSLEKRGPVAKVESFGLEIPELQEEKKQNKEGEKEVQASLNVKVFYQYLPQKLGKVSQPLHLLDSGEEALLKEIENFETIDFKEKEENLAPVGKENPFSFKED